MGEGAGAQSGSSLTAGARALQDGEREAGGLGPRCGGRRGLDASVLAL